MNSERIMVVEDEWIVADQLRRNLEGFGYTVCSTAATGDEAVRKVEADPPDLILMDIVLKGNMDGIEAARRINSRFDIPVLYLTAYTNTEYIERAKQTRFFGYLIKPYHRQELYANIEMALRRHAADEENKGCLDHLTRCYTGMMDAFSGAVELRGPYAPGHHRRVAEFTHAIAKEMGLSDFSMRGLQVAAYVYDISLVGMPAEIIQDADQLAKSRSTLHRECPELSYNILKKVDFPWPIADIVLQQREFYDGSGFPHKIKGEDILIEARILAVAHALEDLTSHRGGFRDAFPLQQAIDEITAHRGSRYDPDVVDACLRLFKRSDV